ncbi:hypothetical protein BPY_00410 [Bifidobacterium psychraerophilum]
MSGLDYAKLGEHDATLAARVIVDVCYELANLSRFGNLDSKALRRYESLKTNAIIENFMSRSEEEPEPLLNPTPSSSPQSGLGAER